MPINPESEALTAKFLEGIYQKITGKPIKITSPEMGPVAEGATRVFRGEKLGDAAAGPEGGARQGRGQLFTTHLPDAIKYMEANGGQGEARVTALDHDSEKVFKGSRVGREDSGRTPITNQEGDPAYVGDMGEGKGTNMGFGPGHRNLASTERRMDQTVFVPTSYANRKQQIIPAFLAALAQHMQGKGAPISDPQNKGFANGGPNPPMQAGMEAGAAIIPEVGIGALAADNAYDLASGNATKRMEEPKNVGGIGPQQYQQELNLGISPGGSPLYEAKEWYDSITPGKALELIMLGGIPLAQRAGSKMWNGLKNAKLNHELATERVPPEGSIVDPAFTGGEGPASRKRLGPEDIKHLDKEPFPSAGATGQPVTPLSMDYTKFPSGETTFSPSNISQPSPKRVSSIPELDQHKDMMTSTYAKEKAGTPTDTQKFMELIKKHKMLSFGSAAVLEEVIRRNMFGGH